MKLNELHAYPGARKKRKRVGRGEGSGHGGSATRCTKGQRSRAGDGKTPGFEGGQMPLLRRVPKRGFSRRRFQPAVSVFNLSWIEKKFGDIAEISPAVLREAGYLKTDTLVKILGDGELTRPVRVKAHRFSKSAMEKLTKAGGSGEIIPAKVAGQTTVRRA